jgi:DNA primase
MRQQNTRILECLGRAANFYSTELLNPHLGKAAVTHIRTRKMSAQTAFKFKLGFASKSFSGIYTNLTGEGFSAQELLSAGLIIESTSPNATSRFYDRFRNRLMIPISNLAGDVVGFGGRDLGVGPADPNFVTPKYLNSPETVVFKKSRTLFGYQFAKKAIVDKGMPSRNS